MSESKSRCRGALIVKGEHFFCDQDAPHDGWACGNSESGAIWMSVQSITKLPSQQEEEAEEWRPVPGYEGRYEVSNLGRVRSMARKFYGHILSRSMTFDGYSRVTLRSAGRSRKSRSIHGLVLAAFVGPLPAGMVSRHLNGDRLDNRLSNLAYGTHSENMRDKVRHGTDPNSARTECIWGHKYTPENTYISPQGWRMCRECNRLKTRQRRAAARAAKASA